MTATGRPRAGRREWIALAVLALPTLLVSLDTFVMLLALPHMSVALGADSTQQLWIMDIYGFIVAGFLITMGKLGDRVGRRRLLLIGAAAFGVASVLAAYSSSPEMLIAARALLGLAGATLTPSTLALIMNLFHDSRQRAGAVGIWASCFAVGAMIGPVVGGLMLNHFWWGSVFLLGVPAMVLLVVVGPILLPEHRSTSGGRLDLTSVVLSLAAILPVVYGLTGIARGGLRSLSVSAVAGGLVIGVVFLRRQHTLTEPLVDLRLFTRRAFSVTLGSMLLYTTLSGGAMLLVAQHLQLVEGLSPLRAGLAMVPAMVVAIAGFQLSPILARRIRPAFLFSGGLAITTVGLLILLRAGAGTASVTLMTGLAVASLGGAPLVSLGTNLVVGSVPPERAGSAAGLVQTGNEFGYALGIAILGSINTAVYRDQITGHIPTGIPSGTAAVAGDSLANATAAAHAIPGQAGADLLAVARESFTSGLHAAAIVSAVLLAGGALLISTMLRRLGPINQSKTDQPDGPDGPVPQTDHEASPISA